MPLVAVFNILLSDLRYLHRSKNGIFWEIWEKGVGAAENVDS